MGKTQDVPAHPTEQSPASHVAGHALKPGELTYVLPDVPGAQRSASHYLAKD